MNEELSWIFYRYTIGLGTFLLGIAAISAVITLQDISKSLKELSQQNIIRGVNNEKNLN